MERFVSLRQTLLDAGNRLIVSDRHGASRSGLDFVAQVDSVARALIEAVGPRPRVGLWYRNSIAALEAFAAVEWTGGTRVPVDPGAAASEAKAIFEAASVDVVLADREHAAALDNKILVHDDHAALRSSPLVELPAFDRNASYLVYPRAVIGGRLFGIRLSYGNWKAIIDLNRWLYSSGRYGQWDSASEKFLTVQQLMHGTGFLGSFPFLAMGLPQVVLDKFEATTVLDTIEQHHITATMLVPAMLNAMTDALATRPKASRSLRHLLYGGGPIAAKQIRMAIDRVGPVMTQVYGRVEAGWPLTVLDPTDHTLLASRPELAASCGRPVDTVQVRLRSLHHDQEQPGELLVRTAMASNDYVDAEGWCSLGDVMRRDDDGYLYYERRLDRMINTGYHVYPDEVEGAIIECGGVEQALVRGEPHPRWGEAVVAYVVVASGQDRAVLIERIEKQLRTQLASYKVPWEFRVVERLPGQ